MVGREAKTEEEMLVSKRPARAGSGIFMKGRGAAAGAEKGIETVRRKEEETETGIMIMTEVESMGGIVSATENGGDY